MRLPRQLPASLRYLKARLRPLRQPMFWGSITVLSLVGLFAWEAWHHPEWLFENPDEESSTAVDPTLSKEDSAVAADMDSLPVLMKELDSAEIGLPAAISTPKAQTQNFLDDFLSNQATVETARSSNSSATEKPAATANTYNPLGVQTPESSSATLNGGNMFPAGNQGSSAPSGVSSTNFLNPTSQNPSTTPVNPLQAALDRLGGAGQTQTSTNRLATEPAGTQQRLQSNPAISGQAAQSASTDSGNLGYARVPGQGYQPGVPYPGTANYSTVPGQGYQPGVPYPGTANYSTVPGQGYQPGVPYPGTSGYGTFTGNNINQNNYIPYLNQPVPVPGAVGIQPVAPVVGPVTPGTAGQSSFQNTTPGSGVVNTGTTPAFGTSQLQPSQLQTQPPRR